MSAKPGHGDHWLAALAQDDPRLSEALAFPADAPEGVALHRRALTEALDVVHVTSRRRLVTAYPEPRATSLVEVRPRELHLWETGAEAWLVAEHAGAGFLTLFLTDLAARAKEYERARGAIPLEVSGLAYRLERAPPTAGPSRLHPARAQDDRFLPDDFSFTADVLRARGAGGSLVLDLGFHGGLEFPVVARGARVGVGERVRGDLWLTARWPEEQVS